MCSRDTKDDEARQKTPPISHALQTGAREKSAESGKGDFRIKVCTQGMPLMIGVHTVSHSKTQVDEKILAIISKSFDRGLCMSKWQNVCIHENEIFVSGTENFNE